MKALAVMMVFALTGCTYLKQRSLRHKFKKTPPPAAEEEKHRLIGTIVLVDVTNRFVLIDVGVNIAPEPGHALKAFADEAESAVLAVSAERRPPFIVADIVKGDPRRGDSVYE